MDLLAASIIIIVTGIYDSRWRVSSRLRLPAIGQILQYLWVNLCSTIYLNIDLWKLRILKY